MKPSTLVSLTLFGLILIGLATVQGTVLVLAIPFALYLSAGLLFGPEEIKLQVRRELSADRAVQGDPVTVTTTVTNTGALLERVYIAQQLPPGLKVLEGDLQTIAQLEPGQSMEIQYTLQGRRGFYVLPGVQAQAQDAFGLFAKETEIVLANRLFVLPRLFRMPQVAIRPRRTRIYPGLIPARKGGPGVEFFGLREYQPGDDQRWVNHRVSARHDQALFVNEFEQERAVDVGLILDVRQVTNLLTNYASLLEYSIQATATLADAFLTYGNRVGLFLYGGAIDWTFPGYGKIQRERILQALARARLEESQVFQKLDHLPTRLFPPRSQLVLISPLRGADLEDVVGLRARGYPLLTITPDPVAQERKILDAPDELDLAVRLARLERGHLFSQLRQAGVQVFEWDVDQPFHRVAQQALRRGPVWSRGPGGH